MVKRKKRLPSMSETAIGGTIATTVVGNVASASGSSTASNLSSNFATGVGNVGRVLPIQGSLIGTGMVLKSTKGLTKAGSKILTKSKRKKL